MVHLSKFLLLSVSIVLLASACQPIVAPENEAFSATPSTGAYAHPEMIIDATWLADHLSDPNLRILDMRDFLVEGDAANRLASYEDGHIPGAVYVDSIEDISDPNATVPLMMLPQDAFEALMGRLGISNDTTVIVYDDSGSTLAARVWWALHYYGYDDVKLLDGGLTKWTLEGLPIDTGNVEPAQATFQAEATPGLLATKADVIAAMEDPKVALIDGLWPEHFRGEGDDPNERVGHIPTAVNIYAMDNLDPEDQTLLPVEALQELWRKADLTPGQAIITYCGAGYYGAFNLFVLNQLGYENVRMYDGSWLEWAADPSLPVEVGDPAAS